MVILGGWVVLMCEVPLYGTACRKIWMIHVQDVQEFPLNIAVWYLPKRESPVCSIKLTASIAPCTMVVDSGTLHSLRGVAISP
jgi:hypothetical protein